MDGAETCPVGSRRSAERSRGFESSTYRQKAFESPALRQEEEELRDASTDELLTEDMKKPEVWWWLSFASEKGFLGVVIMHGGGMAEAVQNAWSMNLNPGGEVQGVPIPEEHVPEAKYRRRLLSRAELKEAGLA